MPPKRKHPWQDHYSDQFGLNVTSRNAATKKVDSAVCLFCQAFGREVTWREATVRKRKMTKSY